MIQGSHIVRRKEAKKGIRLTIMIVGESGTGKTTFVNALLDQRILDHKYHTSDANVSASAWERAFLPHTAHEEPGISITETSVEIIDEDDLKLLLNIIDTPGFGENINNEVCAREIINYLKQQFDLVLSEETKVRRNPHFVDSRVHVCLYFITPTGHGLREMDVECMKRLSTYVNVMPVIARADSFTEPELRRFKKLVMEDIERFNVPVFEFTYDEDEDDYDVIQEIEFLNKIQPFAVVASETVIAMPDGSHIRGRKYPWGVINIDDAKFSDFPIIKSVLLGSHLQDLKDLTHDFLYENYRTERLSNVTGMQFEDDRGGNLLPREFSFAGKGTTSLSNLASLATSELTMSMFVPEPRARAPDPAPAGTPRMASKSSMLFDDSTGPAKAEPKAETREETRAPIQIQGITEPEPSSRVVLGDDRSLQQSDTSSRSREVTGAQRDQMRMMSETIPYVLNHERIEQQKLKLQQLEERQVRELQMRADMLERRAKELRARERKMRGGSMADELPSGLGEEEPVRTETGPSELDMPEIPAKSEQRVFIKREETLTALNKELE